MDNLGNILALVFSAISSVAACIYYLSPRESQCYECKQTISHQKENRYYVEVNSQKHALCKRCYVKQEKESKLLAKNCSCCLKSFSTRMKIHKWDAKREVYYLCSTCNKIAQSKLNTKFKLQDVLPDDFIQTHTESSSLELFTKKSGINVQSSADLKSPIWSDYISRHSNFSSWSEMEVQAITELYSRERQKIIDNMQIKT